MGWLDSRTVLGSENNSGNGGTEASITTVVCLDFVPR